MKSAKLEVKPVPRAERLKEIPTQKNNQNQTNTNKTSDTDTDTDTETDTDTDTEINNNYQLIADMYNNTCVSFPRLTKLSDNRKKAIKARLKKYSLDEIKRVFELAEQSDFLKGNNNRNWSASFDWLMNDTNMAKVLDGNYNNRTRSSPPTGATDFSKFEYAG